MVKVFDIDIPWGYAGHVRSLLRHIDIGDGECERPQAEVQDLIRLTIELGKKTLAALAREARDYDGGYGSWADNLCVLSKKEPSELTLRDLHEFFQSEAYANYCCSMFSYYDLETDFEAYEAWGEPILSDFPSYDEGWEASQRDWDRQNDYETETACPYIDGTYDSEAWHEGYSNQSRTSHNSFMRDLAGPDGYISDGLYWDDDD